MLIAWLMMKMVQASTSVESASCGLSARKYAIRPDTMQSQSTMLRRPAIASRPGDRSEANPFSTDSANRSTKTPTRDGRWVAIRSMTVSVGFG